MFLLGKVGPYRRHLALAFAEMLQKEVEIVTITQDTTEVSTYRLWLLVGLKYNIS